MKFAFATAILKIETSRIRRRFARVSVLAGVGRGEPGEPGYEFVEHLEE